MRRLATVLLLSYPAYAADSAMRPLSAAEFRDLAKQCLPDAPFSTLRAIAKVESAYNPVAISINYPDRVTAALALEEGTVELSRPPASLREAVQWTKWFYAHGLSVSIGLMQINTEHLSALGLSLDQAFEPCANLRAGWSILNDKYRSAVAIIGKGQLALHAALSAYNSGSLTVGFNTGYVEKVINTKPPLSSIPQFAGPSSMSRALVPPNGDPLNMQIEPELAGDDPNIAPTRVSWIRK